MPAKNTPKRRPADSTRERILLVALDVFSEHGYDGTTTREICKRADVNVAALNYHWGSKERLWIAVCELCSHRFLAVFQDLLELEGGPEEAVQKIVGTMFDVFIENPKPARILTWASLQAESMDFDATEKVFEPLTSMGVAYVENLQSEGKLPADVDAHVAIALLYGQMIFAFVDQPGHRRFFGKDFGDREHAERVKRALVRQAQSLFGLSQSGPVKRRSGARRAS